MAPTLPYFRSPRGRCAAITLSSSLSDQSATHSLVILSSATFTTGSVVIVPDSSPSRGRDEARGWQSSAPRHRRSPSTLVRSPTIVTATSFANGSGLVATSRPTPAAQRRCSSPCSVLSVRAPGGGSGEDEDDDDEATSRPKKKYRKWGVDDELKVLSTLAELRWVNLGVLPQASVLLKAICADGGLRRRSVNATDLSEKVYKLKKKFTKAADKVAASGRRLRNYRDRVLFETSMEVWPDLVPDDVAAAFLLQVATATRRRGNHARVRL